MAPLGPVEPPRSPLVHVDQQLEDPENVAAVASSIAPPDVTDKCRTHTLIYQPNQSAFRTKCLFFYQFSKKMLLNTCQFSIIYYFSHKILSLTIQHCLKWPYMQNLKMFMIREFFLFSLLLNLFKISLPAAVIFSIYFSWQKNWALWNKTFMLRIKININININIYYWLVMEVPKKSAY